MIAQQIDKTINPTGQNNTDLIVSQMNAGVRSQYQIAVNSGNTEAAKQLIDSTRALIAAKTRLKGISVDTSIPSPSDKKQKSGQIIRALSFAVDLSQRGVRSYLDNELKKGDLYRRIAEVLPPKRNASKIDQNIESQFYQQTKGQTLDASSIRILAAMTPSEVLHHAGATNLAVDFEKYGQRSGNYWKDIRTGMSFDLGNALQRELIEHDVARQVLKLKPSSEPGSFSRNAPSIWEKS